MRSVIQIAEPQIAEIVRQCAAFDLAIPFSTDRANFVLALVKARKARLLTVLGE
jgi:hypothetical protein